MITIRPMQEKDLKVVSEIEKESFALPWSYEAFLRELYNPFSLSLVAERNGDVLGYAIALIYSSSLHLANIAVRKDSRRKGIGSLLLKEVEKKARKFGMKSITLEVRASNKSAQKFYKKNKYSLVGIQKGYYPPTGEDAFVFEKVVRKVRELS